MLFGKFGGGSVSWLLVCLGNPGREYAETRHNVGFLAADLLSREKGVKVDRLKFRALTGTVTLGGEKVLVMKPQTFMNLSGEAVGQAARFYKLPPQRVLVIQDDVALPLGKLRIRANGSAGGHNGLKSIIAHLGSEEFPRIKVGVGAPQHPEHEMVDWVIGKFTPAERKVLDQALQKAVDAAECVIGEGVQKAQNRYN
ncbi:MAG: aminoacyl-tRNA hydrolase [Oscillospiraceae bacterium]